GIAWGAAGEWNTRGDVARPRGRVTAPGHRDRLRFTCHKKRVFAILRPNSHSAALKQLTQEGKENLHLPPTGQRARIIACLGQMSRKCSWQKTSYCKLADPR